MRILKLPRLVHDETVFELDTPELMEPNRSSMDSCLFMLGLNGTSLIGDISSKGQTESNSVQAAFITTKQRKRFIPNGAIAHKFNQDNNEQIPSE